jgi:hypothetical protein
MGNENFRNASCFAVVPFFVTASLSGADKEFRAVRME